MTSPPNYLSLQCWNRNPKNREKSRNVLKFREFKEINNIIQEFLLLILLFSNPLPALKSEIVRGDVMSPPNFIFF